MNQLFLFLFTFPFTKRLLESLFKCQLAMLLPLAFMLGFLVGNLERGEPFKEIWSLLYFHNFTCGCHCVAILCKRSIKIPSSQPMIGRRGKSSTYFGNNVRIPFLGNGLKIFKIEWIFSHTNPISEISSHVDVGIGIAPLFGGTSECLCILLQTHMGERLVKNATLVFSPNTRPWGSVGWNVFYPSDFLLSPPFPYASLLPYGLFYI